MILMKLGTRLALLSGSGVILVGLGLLFAIWYERPHTERPFEASIPAGQNQDTAPDDGQPRNKDAAIEKPQSNERNELLADERRIINEPATVPAQETNREARASEKRLVPALNLSARKSVELSKGTGELILFNKEGVLLRTNGGFTRIKFPQLSDNDVRVLLQISNVYHAVVANRSA